MSKEIRFVTTNNAKVDLANKRLGGFGIEVIQKGIELIEPRAMHVEEVALSKAEQVFERNIQYPFIVEDSGVIIPTLSDFPGVYVKLAFHTLGPKRILKMMSEEQNRDIIVKSVLIYGDPSNKDTKIFEGKYKGIIPTKQRGGNKRGWAITDMFIPEGFDKTLAEMSDEEWKTFLKNTRQNDHFQKFGEWFSTNH